MMIINDRNDLDAAPDDVRGKFLASLAASINAYQWQNGEWVLIQSTGTIERFGFTIADFPDAPVPDKPTNNPDADQAEREKAERIAELKQLLADTDYVGLADYDKDQPELKAQRQAWRDEIRQLEG